MRHFEQVVEFHSAALLTKMLTKHSVVSIVRAAVKLIHVIDFCAVGSLSFIGALAGRHNIILFTCGAYWLA
jgi:hypothetical protein